MRKYKATSSTVMTGGLDWSMECLVPKPGPSVIRPLGAGAPLLVNLYCCPLLARGQLSWVSYWEFAQYRSVGCLGAPDWIVYLSGYAHAFSRVCRSLHEEKESPGREGGTPGARTGSCSRSTTPSRELIVGPESTRVN